MPFPVISLVFLKNRVHENTGDIDSLCMSLSYTYKLNMYVIYIHRPVYFATFIFIIMKYINSMK